MRNSPTFKNPGCKVAQRFVLRAEDNVESVYLNIRYFVPSIQVVLGKCADINPIAVFLHHFLYGGGCSSVMLECKLCIQRLPHTMPDISVYHTFRILQTSPSFYNIKVKQYKNYVVLRSGSNDSPNSSRRYSWLLL